MVDRDAYADLTTLVPVALLLDLRLPMLCSSSRTWNRRSLPSSSRPGFRPARPDCSRCWVVHCRLAACISNGTRRTSRPLRNGTLVWFAGVHYILTAAHVWEKLCRGAAPASVGLTLRENLDHKYLIDRAAIVATGPRSQPNGMSGTGHRFSSCSPEHVGAIEVYRVFWNLARKQTLGCQRYLHRPESSDGHSTRIGRIHRDTCRARDHRNVFCA